MLPKKTGREKCFEHSKRLSEKPVVCRACVEIVEDGGVGGRYLQLFLSQPAKTSSVMCFLAMLIMILKASSVV
jgi:hypothetical protein